MLIRIIMVFLLLTTLSCGPNEKTAKDFFPLKQGSRLEYEGVTLNESGNVKARFKQILTVLAPREMDNQRVIPIRYENVSLLIQGTSIGFFGRDTKGIYCYKYQTDKDETPQALPISKNGDKFYFIINPLRKGTKITGKNITITIDSTNETVTVPAGTYNNCVKVTRKLVKSGLVSTLWFCQGIGVVKAIENTLNKGKRIMQLSSYTASKKIGNGH
jgi:hypothetical protein